MRSCTLCLRRKGKHMLLLVKVDIAKAYDWISWKLLETLFRNFGLHDAFICWIMQCVSMTSLQVLFNGTPCCSISPYLFILYSEVLSWILIRVESDRAIKGIKLGKKSLLFTHILFADNLLLFGSAKKKNAKAFLIASKNIDPSWDN